MLRTIKQILSSSLTFANVRVRSFLKQNEAIHSSKRPRIWLRLEILEDRTVPSTYTDYWYGKTSSDWGTASNWMTDQDKQVVPDKNANVVFGAVGTTSNPCTMNVSGGATVNSLSMGVYFTGQKLTLNTSLTVKDNGDGQSTGFFLAGDSIAQPNGAASAINCYGPFNWSSGAIGSQTTGGASNLNLYAGPSGVEADTIGGSGTTETLGDSLAINIGVTLTVTGEANNITPA